MKTSSAKDYLEIKIKGSNDPLLIDKEDWEKFGHRNWYVNTNGYVVSDVSNKRTDTTLDKERLHRLILNAKKGEDIDHINTNKLDNRKFNLRIVDRSKNLANRDLTAARGKLQGAFYRKDRKVYFSTITCKEKGIRNKYLGKFKTELEAHEAYRKAHLELYGKHSVFYRLKNEI